MQRFFIFGWVGVISICILFFNVCGCNYNTEQEKEIDETAQELGQLQSDDYYQDAWEDQIEQQSKEVLEAIANKKYRTMHKYAMNRFRYSGANPDRMNAFSSQQVEHVRKHFRGHIQGIRIDSIEGKWRARAIYDQAPRAYWVVTWYRVMGEWRYYALERTDSMPEI